MIKIRVENLNPAETDFTVKIGNADAIVSRFHNDTVTAYIPENAQEGKNKLRLLLKNSSSNAVDVTVTNRAATGRVLWKFQADDSYIQGRAGIGPDETIYALGINGHLYAITPQGALKWIYTATYGSVQSVSVGNDGTIYFAGLNTIYAINPNGSLKWKVTNPGDGLFVAGPNVGPDGNIYAVADNLADSGLSAISLTPSGALRWNKPGYLRARETAGQTKEIVFSAGQLYFNLNRVDAISGLQALKMSNGDRVWTGAGGTRQPAVAPDGRIYTISAALANSYAEISAFSTTGNVIRKYFGTGTKDLTPPDVGSDGVFYVGQNYQYLIAERPNGAQKFSVTAKSYIGSPVVSPQNNAVVFGGSPSFAPGYVAAVSTTGQSKWSVSLSLGNGKYASPLSRPKFSKDGSAVYIGTTLNYTTSSCYLYAIATAATGFADSNSEFDLRESKVTDIQKSKSTLEFYPNPAINLIHVKVSGKRTVTLSDNSGKIYISKMVDGVSDLSVSSLQPGIYFISDGTNGKGEKVLIQR